MKINILDISVIVLKLMMLISLILLLLVSFNAIYPSGFSKIASTINDEYKVLLQGKVKSNAAKKSTIWSSAVKKFFVKKA